MKLNVTKRSRADRLWGQRALDRLAPPSRKLQPAPVHRGSVPATSRNNVSVHVPESSLSDTVEAGSEEQLTYGRLRRARREVA